MLLNVTQILKEILRLIGQNHDVSVAMPMDSDIRWAIHSAGNAEATKALALSAKKPEDGSLVIQITIDGKSLPSLPINTAFMRPGYNFDDFTSRHLLPAIKTIIGEPENA